MAAKNFDSIVGDIIDNVLLTNPSADVKIGEVIRDIFIDVQALQIQALYGIADAAARAQSILTARAQQLDRLAYNVNLTRNGATSSVAIIVISIKGGVLAPTLLNIGDQFFTLSDAQNTTQTFINTMPTLLVTGQTQVSLPVINVQTGSIGNVAANTITQSTYDFADEIYNPAPAVGGTDVESDASLAIRIPLQITGQFLNTYKGIQNAIQQVTDLNGTPYVVTPDNPLSRGPYTSDVYLQLNSNYQGTPEEETAPANLSYYVFEQQPIYHLNPINTISVFNPNTNAYVALPPSVAGNPTYSIIEDPGDAQGFFIGSTKAATRLQWIVQPPAAPFIISYNYDHTIIDSQNAYDINNEITNDLLFKQAPAIPIYVTANVTAIQGANLIQIYQNAQLNLSALFNNLVIGQSLTETEVEVALLQDSNVYDIQISNLDSTYEIELPLSPNGAGTITTGQLTPSQISELNPLGYFYEVVTGGTGTFAQFASVGRLWIGDPNIINQNNFNPSTGFSFNQATYNGVADEDTVGGISTSAGWVSNTYKFYDPVTKTFVLSFATAPPTDGSAQITINLVNNYIATGNNLSYLTLAPSIISPIQAFTNNTNTSNPQYVTVLPNDQTGNAISFVQAGVYKNGVLLTQGNATSAGDYFITQPDSITGIIQITFSPSATPNPTDILQYGILNPNLTVSFTTAKFI